MFVPASLVVVRSTTGAIPQRRPPNDGPPPRGHTARRHRDRALGGIRGLRAPESRHL